MPAYELIKEEQAAAKRASKALDAKVPDLHVPAVPHFLPLTKWCAALRYRCTCKCAMCMQCVQCFPLRH
jgi:hypothetical protein